MGVEKKVGRVMWVKVACYFLRFVRSGRCSLVWAIITS
jgi:hypothetical protein